MIATIYGCISTNDESVQTPKLYGCYSVQEQLSKHDMHNTLLRIKELAKKLEGALRYYKTLSGVDTDSIVKSVRGIQIVALDEIDRLSRKESSDEG